MKTTPEPAGVLDPDISAFLDHLRIERRLSPRTLEAYRHDLLSLHQHRAARDLPGWDRLDTQHLRHFIASQHQQGLAPRSLQRLLSAIRSFYRFLQREGRAQQNPALDLRAPKAARPLPRTLDADLATQLLDSPGEDDWLGRRDQAMLELFYSSGLRL